MPQAPAPHGYSGKPLYQKLGLKPGMRCLPLNPPRPYAEIVPGMEGVTVLTDPAEADVVHLFCHDRAGLDAGFGPAVAHVAEKGMLWVSWPKKSSTLFIDLTEDGIREVIAGSGWVDVKVCAVDADWSGLKLLRRRTG